jgi:hypothetical protein
MAALLDLFIRHFIEMARKSNHFKAPQQAKFYRKHAERLQKLLREYDDCRKEEYDHSKEFEMLNEEMDNKSKAQPSKPAQPKQSAPSETPKKPEHKNVNFPKTTQSQNHIFNTNNPFRHKTYRHSPLPSTETCDEQSQPNTNIVTHAQVHRSNTSRTTHTPPNMSTNPDSRIDVTDNPPLSPTLTLTEDITVESTDT